MFDWTYSSNDFRSPEHEGYNILMENEEWVGDEFSFLYVMVFLTIPKFYAIVIFAIALCKISRLMAKLKQFGVVNNTCVLRLHVIYMTFDLIACIGSNFFCLYVAIKHGM